MTGEQLTKMALALAVFAVLLAIAFSDKAQENRERYESCQNKGGTWVTTWGGSRVCAKLEFIQP